MDNSRNPWTGTPLIESSTLSKAAGCRIFLKLENLQPSGSFKSRGVGNYMQRALSKCDSPNHVHFYSSSGGNAGLACVHAARKLGRPASVIVPESTKPMMLNKIRAAGASEVIQHGPTWADADKYLRESVLVEANNRGETGIYVPPFNHPDIWAGNATIIPEIKQQLPALTRGNDEPDVLICSVGGGGLFNGVVDGVEAASWTQTRILALETHGADALNKSLAEGKQITLPGITSLATSLGAVRVSDRTYELASTRKQVTSWVFSDAEAAMGCWRLADDERLMVELGCGVNVAPCYGGRLSKVLGREVSPDMKVVIVLCGGSAVTVDMLSGWKHEFGHLVDEQTTEEKKTVPSAATNGV